MGKVMLEAPKLGLCPLSLSVLCYRLCLRICLRLRLRLRSRLRLQFLISLRLKQRPRRNSLRARLLPHNTLSVHHRTVAVLWYNACTDSAFRHVGRVQVHQPFSRVVSLRWEEDGKIFIRYSSSPLSPLARRAAGERQPVG